MCLNTIYAAPLESGSRLPQPYEKNPMNHGQQMRKPEDVPRSVTVRPVRVFGYVGAQMQMTHGRQCRVFANAVGRANTQCVSFPP